MTQAAQTNFANYTEAYQALRGAHENMSKMTEANVEAIAPCLETAVLAHRFCMDRIAAVRKSVSELQAAAGQTG